MNVGSRKNQAGFSLVELMVVVAIIGILASLAIPSVGKYMAKARQSEAKTQLASVYTAEKAFHAEYTAYDNRFGAIGYAPEGKLRYIVGFTGGTVAGAANGYTTTLTGIGLNINSFAYCGVAAGMPNGCMAINGATNVAPSAANIPANSVTANGTFLVGAGAIVHTNGIMDQWTMNQNKSLTNTNPGVL